MRLDYIGLDFFDGLAFGRVKCDPRSVFEHEKYSACSRFRHARIGRSNLHRSALFGPYPALPLKDGELMLSPVNLADNQRSFRHEDSAGVSARRELMNQREIHRREIVTDSRVQEIHAVRYLIVRQNGRRASW